MRSELWLLLIVTGLIFGCVLSCLAQALRDLRKPLLEEIATIRKRPGATARVNKIIDDVEGHAASIALPRVVCNLLVVIALTLWVAELRQVERIDWPEIAIGVAVSTLLLWVFGTVIPASIARHAGESLVYRCSLLLRMGYWLVAPFRPFVRLVDEVVRRLAGSTAESTGKAIEQELLSVVEEAQEEGKFDNVERDMIEAVVRFRDRTVAQVMTPRTQIEAMPLSNDLSKVTASIRTIGHSRIPVFEGDMDHIVGIFYVKDLMRWLAGDGGGSRTGRLFDLRALLRPAYFVPETKTVRELLPELLNKRVHIAMVADEYGGTAGLVTFEDIVEEVFGDIQDEYEQPEESTSDVTIDQVSRTAEIDAAARIEDVNIELRRLGGQLPTSEDYETVGGFVTVTLGRIPTAGESFPLEPNPQSNAPAGHIQVLTAQPTRVTRVRVAFEQSVPTRETVKADAGK
jgi:putative hemolysin